MNQVSEILKKPVVVFIVALLIVRLLPELGLQFYDEGTDSYYQVSIEGLFTAEPESLPAAWGKWTFISKIHQWLYQLCPPWNWYSIIMLALTAWCLQLFVAVILLFLDDGKQWKSRILKTGLMLALGLLIWENVALIQFTRISQFLCFFGLLLMTMSLQLGKLNWKTVLNGNAAFIIGTMIRLEPGILALGLLLPLAISNMITHDLKVRKLIPLLIAPVLTCIVISYLINNAATESDELTVLHNKFLHNTDGVQYGTNELNISTKADSLAYEITFAYFMNDPKHLNQEFSDRIGLKPFMSSKTLTDHVTRVEKFVERWNRNIEYLYEHIGLVILFVLISVAALIFPFKTDFKFRLAVIGTIGLFVAYYVIIAGYMKMDHHVFVPLLFCFCFILILLVGSSSKWKPLQVVLILATAGAITHEFDYLKYHVERKQKETRIMSEYFTRAQQLNKTYMVFDMRAIFRMYTKPFQEIPIQDWSNAASFDNGLIFVLPTYEEKLKKVAGSTDLRENWKFFSERSHETIFLAKGERLKKITAYFNQQYDMDMRVYPYSEELSLFHAANQMDVQHDLGIYVVSEGADSNDQSISRNDGPGNLPL